MVDFFKRHSLKSFLNPKKILFIFVIVYCIFFGWFSIFKHISFKTYAFDLGVFCQALWSSNNGKLLYETPDMYWNPSGNFFGVHFSPFILFFIPLYYIFSNPYILLLLQTIGISISVIPIYYIANHILGDTKKSLLLSLTFLMHPATHGINSFDFHLEAFTTFLVLTYFYYLIKGNFLRSLIFYVLSIITMDIVPVFIFFISLSWLIKKKDDLFNSLKINLYGLSADLKISLITLLLSPLIFLFFIKMTSFFGPIPFTNGSITWFPHLGTNKLEIIINLFNIRRIFSAVSYNFIIKFLYWIFLLMPLFFLPLFGGETVLMLLPWVLASTLTTYRPWYELGWHYPALVLPAIYISTIFGIKNLQNRMRDIGKGEKIEVNYFLKNIYGLFLILMIITSTIFISSYFSSIFFSKSNILNLPLRGSAYDPPNFGNHEKKLAEILKMIPSNGSVFTQNNIFPHLCNRFDAYVWLPEKVYPDYILVDLQSSQIHTKIDNKTILEIINDIGKEYGIFASMDGIILMKRFFSQEPSLFQPINLFYNLNNISVDKRLVQKYVEKRYVILQTVEDEVDVLWFGPYITLPKGRYEVQFKLKIENFDKNDALLVQITKNKGQNLIASRIIRSTDNNMNKWFSLTLPFNLDNITEGLELRGKSLGNEIDVFLEGYRIKQIEY
jgi:uncharacterized membrane protein